MSEVFNAQSAATFECASVLLVGFNRPFPEICLGCIVGRSFWYNSWDI